MLAGSGTLDFIPLWTPDGSTLGNSILFQSTSSNIGVGTQTPAAKLDVRGSATVRGPFSLPAAGSASAAAGTNSNPLNLTASAFNSAAAAAGNQTFRWRAEPAGNNTASPSGTLNLLVGEGANTPSVTGLHIGSNGVLTFAPGQTFPGTGTITSVGLSAPSSDFSVSGSPVTTSGTLGLKWNVAPTSANTANAIVKRDSAGSFSAGAITANLGITALYSGPAAVTGTNSSSGLGVYGTSAAGPAIWGQSSGSSAISDGVHGETSSARRLHN